MQEIHKRKINRHLKLQNHPSAGSGHLYMRMILFQQIVFLIAHIKTRKCSEIEMMPSLDSEDHPQGFSGKKSRHWRGIKGSEDEETGQMDRGLQGDPTRGKKEENRLL